jgi:preprotein translocase subunit YajC
MAALLPILALVVLMYFLLIRPQQRRMREQQAMLSAVEEGDEILTSSGLYGFITAMEGDTIWVEIAEGVEVRVAKGAVARRIKPHDATADQSAGTERDASNEANETDEAQHPTDDES